MHFRGVPTPFEGMKNINLAITKLKDSTLEKHTSLATSEAS